MSLDCKRKSEYAQEERTDSTKKAYLTCLIELPNPNVFCTFIKFDGCQPDFVLGESWSGDLHK